VEKDDEEGKWKRSKKRRSEPIQQEALKPGTGKFDHGFLASG
jgi:hypothetical protein